MFDDDVDTNPSTNPSLEDVIGVALSRRRVLKMGGAAASLGFLASLGGAAVAEARPGGGRRHRTPRPARPLIGFTSVPLPSVAQLDLTVAEGYTAKVLYAWGDPVSNGPAFLPDASQTWVEQEQQAGMHHDGIAFFAFNDDRGLLAINHEYCDPGLLFPMIGEQNEPVWSADKAKKLLAAHGVSVIEVRRRGRHDGHRGHHHGSHGSHGSEGEWEVKRPSRWGRRITGYTPTRVVGPAAGSPLLQTGADPTGRTVLGTLNNCGGSATPWGTYVTGEENYDFYFLHPAGGPAALTLEERRYMQSALSGAIGVHKGDPRFDMNVPGNRNEPNRFGWIVEIDPFDPRSTPLKLTGLGRFKHEMAAVRLTRDGRAVAYSGDDERNNYVYKFIGSRTVKQAKRARRSPLEDGTLYVARFEPGDAAGDGMGSGEWIPLTPDNPALAGWSIDRILVYARLAADAVGATRMDRPEWISVAPDGHVYVCCTNNTRRGRSTTNPTEAAGELPTNFTAPTDDANPRGGAAGNPYGQIIRWREDGDADALTFTWDIFALAGDPGNPAGLPDGLGGAPAGGNVVGDIYAAPDAVTVDGAGRIWIGTDLFSAEAGLGPYANLTNNVLLAADPVTRETRRFMVGPVGCEVTGITFNPDRTAMFVDIQHPGEPASIFTNNFADVQTSWPDFGGARPRSATMVITKDDGGVIGT
jgi:secreted PhoX family phosphatase